MRIGSRVAWVLGALLLIGVAGAAHVFAADEEYFPQTGHTVRQPFLDYFYQTGGAAAHGYPITDEFVDPASRLLVQYFEKSRMEWHPGNEAPYRVQLGLLGDELDRREAPLPIRQIAARGNPNCLYTPETGHQVCHAFLDFWQANGGLERFGYPIGRYSMERGRLVQWFQRARLEWQPERPAGERVWVADLGREAYTALGLDPKRLEPILLPPSFGQVIKLQARATMLRPVITPGSPQTVFVFVSDQFGSARGDAAVTIILHYPNGDEVVLLPPTNAQGVSQATFDVPKVPAGSQVIVEVLAGYRGLFVRTVGSFLVWY